MLLNRYNTWAQGGRGGEQLIAEELDNIFYGNVESENVIKNLHSHAEEQNKEDVMYQGQKEKFITYFILDEDQHNMICVSSKSISSVAECPLSAGGSSSILIDSSTPKPSQGISSNPHRFKEPCLQN